MADGFSGFTKETLPFLKALDFHQNREWFHENKNIYERAVKTPMGDLVEDVSARFEAAKIPLKGSRKKSLYRVNRDVRFSKNKDPYVTHGSFMLTRSGDKKENGFVYMHFSNERTFIASGFYSLSGDEMRAFRERIIREKDKMAKLVGDMQRHGYKFDMSETLKRNPRGFEAVEGDPLQAWVRLKNYTFIEELTSADLLMPELAEKLFLLGCRSLDFLNFGWTAIDPLRESFGS
jgi:uncharacterized protein (TIGR02453 family)